MCLNSYKQTFCQAIIFKHDVSDLYFLASVLFLSIFHNLTANGTKLSEIIDSGEKEIFKSVFTGRVSILYNKVQILFKTEVF